MFIFCNTIKRFITSFCLLIYCFSTFEFLVSLQAKMCLLSMDHLQNKPSISWLHVNNDQKWSGCSCRELRSQETCIILCRVFHTIQAKIRTRTWQNYPSTCNNIYFGHLGAARTTCEHSIGIWSPWSWYGELLLHTSNTYRAMLSFLRYLNVTHCR